MRHTNHLIILGAGAAGLMCTIEAGRRGLSVLVLERSEKIGNKIRVSGGGRCNFTNLYASPHNFISRNPHFCKSALACYTPLEFIALVEKHGIAYHERKLGQLFCDKTSEELIRMLETEYRAANVEIRMNCAVESVSKNGGLFEVRTNQGIFQSQSLVVATGGLSFPKIGATSFGYEIAKQFGLAVVPCKPALVPLTWNSHDREIYGELSGLSLDAIVRCERREFREAVLFTHRGLSGPAILQISSYWEKGKPIIIDLLPGKEILDELIKARNQQGELTAILTRYLPRRLAQKWCAYNAPAKPMGQLSDLSLRVLSERPHCWQIVPDGTEGYEKAEVTAGGVDTQELSSKTMESKKVPGLYFTGEVMDITGHLGGYNFQWAWASGAAAGRAVRDH